MNTFKAGDKVYYPPKSTKVLTVYEYDDSNHPIMVDLGSGHTYTFTIDGKFYIGNARPSIFHATPENHRALEQLYGVELEAPPVNPTSREIIVAMLEHGDKSVSCWVSNSSEHPSHDNFWVFVNDYSDGMEFPYEDTEGEQWKFATPFDHTTLQPITELPEGEYYE